MSLLVRPRSRSAPLPGLVVAAPRRLLRARPDRRHARLRELRRPRSSDGEVPYRDFGSSTRRARCPSSRCRRSSTARLPVRRVRVADGAVRRGHSCSRASRWRRGALGPASCRLALVALSPLALGSVVLTRFDLWPAVLTAFALAALVAERRGSARAARRGRRGEALPGRPAAARRRLRLAAARPARGARAARPSAPRSCSRCSSRSSLVAPGGVLRQLRAPALAAAADREPRRGAAARRARPSGSTLEMHSSHGSQNIVGTLPGTLAVLSSIAQVAVLVVALVAFARGPLEPRGELVRVAAAAVLTRSSRSARCSRRSS